MRPGSRLLLAAAALGLAACAAPPEEVSAPESRLEHAGFGVRADLEGWQVYTEAASAPPVLRSAFAGKRGPDDAPWFVALRGEEVLTAGAQRSDLGIDPEDFVRRMQEQLGEGGRIENVRLLPGGDVAFEIHLPALSTSTHYLLHADDGRVLHITLAGAGGLPPVDDFVDALRRFEVRGDAGWVAPWPGPGGLEGEPLAGWEAPAVPEPRGFEAVECGPGEHPLFWSADTGAGRLHLFGSIHFGHPSFYPLAPPIEEAFAGSERLVVEMDLAARQQEVVAALSEPAGDTRGRPLSEQLSPELYAQLSEALLGYGVPASVLEGMSPGMVGAVLAALAFTSRGFDAESGVDLYFLRRAGDRDIVELESASQQAGLIGGFDEGFLRQSLASLERADADVAELHRAWRCGDEQGLLDALGAGDAVAATPEEQAWLEEWRETALYRRNEQMAERIGELLALEGDTFVVVGAAHLVGERGIPELLREAGVPVERIGP